MSPKWGKIEKALFPKYGINHFPGNVAAQAEIPVNSARIAALKTAVRTRQVVPGMDNYEAASKEQSLLEMRNEFLRSRSGAASTPGTASSSRTTSSGRTASSVGVLLPVVVLPLVGVLPRVIVSYFIFSEIIAAF